MNATASFPIVSMPPNFWKQIKRVGPLSAIILLHIGFFYALQSGLIKQAAEAFPKEVFATFITPDRAPEPAPPKAQPLPQPKVVPVVKKTVRPPLPVIDKPSATAVTAPPTPATPVIAAPSAPAEPSPAPAPTAPATPRTITSGVEYIQPPRPEYPAIAKRMGEEGQVVLRVLVNEKGRSEGVEIQKSSGSSRLDEAGRQAVQRALFKPYLDNGKPLAVYAIVPIKFQLDN